MGRTMGVVLAVVAAAGVARPQDDKNGEKEAEARARERLEAFRAQLKKCREVADFVNALDGLGREPHPLILAELKGWLGKPAPEVRMAAADEIGRFKGDAKAAAALLAAARSDKIVDVAVRCLRGIGSIAQRASAKDLVGFFDHRETDVAKEAIDSSGALKSRVSIEPLIELVARLESDRDRRPRGQDIPGGLPAPGGGLGGRANDDDEKRRRANELLPRVVEALRKITGEKLTASKEWRKWWAKSKPFFKDEEEEGKKP